MGHIGLTPQSVHKLGGYVVQGRTEEKAAKMVADAKALEAAGCYALILEMVPAELAAEITRSVSMPVIGIGAGAGCDGQVLVIYDLLGLNPDFTPRFVKRYLDLGNQIKDAAMRFKDDVKRGSFPGPEHSFSSEPTPKLQLYSTPGK
jgi:3-methyl-2-oxobutanoate hydroxymethyltransferase